VTRKVVLALAENLFPIEIRDISRTELMAADEIFITGTSKGIVPVVQVDDGVIADGTARPADPAAHGRNETAYREKIKIGEFLNSLI
jgi:branched-subunit amino acid aminotransferase/4-amino-4-deoxychorismate lyase